MGTARLQEIHLPAQDKEEPFQTEKRSVLKRQGEKHSDLNGGDWAEG